MTRIFLPAATVIKGHTIRKVNFFVQKVNFDKTLQFSREIQSKLSTMPNIFTSFSPQIFDHFSREIKVVNSLKVQNRSIFTSNHQNNSTIFLKVEFLDKKLRFRTV